MVAALLLLPLASAASTGAVCARPYSAMELAKDLGDVESGLRNMDDSLFDAAGRRLQGGLPCLSVAVPPPVHAAAYRYLGAWYWIIPGDSTSARGWFRTSLELDGAYAWDVNELELANPMRQAWEAERAAAAVPPVGIAGKILAAPLSSGTVPLSGVPDAQVRVDGRPMTEASLTTSRPHIVQFVSGLGPGGEPLVARTWLVQGNDLPAELVTDPPVVVAEAGRAPKKTPTRSETTTTTTNADGYQIVNVQRQRPPAKTPLLLVGAATMLAAGGVYGLAWQSHEQFGTADTSAEVYDLSKQTNALVMASGGVLVLGLGVGGWGVLMDGGAAFGLTSRF